MASKEVTKLDLVGLSPAAVCEAINQKFGAGTAVTGSVVKRSQITMIPTGNARIDLALGGGFPENRMTEIQGEFSAGKTTLGLSGLAQHQRIYKRDGIGVIVDVEKSFDPVYAARLGVDLNRTIIISPDSGEQAVDVFSETLRLGRPTYILFDSIAALVPTAEAEGTMDQQHMGLQARLVNRMMRIATGRMKQGLYDRTVPAVTVVALNQIRHKIGVMFGSPETTPGGKGKEFTYSVMIRLASSPAKLITEVRERNGKKKKIKKGAEVTFTIKKNKCFNSLFMDGEYNYFVRKHNGYPAFCYDNAAALLDYGVFLGVIEREKTTNIWGDLRGIDKKFVQLLIEDEDSQDELYHAVLDRLKADAYELAPENEFEDEEESETVSKPKVKLIKKSKTTKARKPKVKLRKKR